MVQIKLPPARPYAYQLHGGGYDGSIFVCGPGMPQSPPFRLTVVDELPNGESREFGLEQGSIPMLRNVLAAASPDQYRIVVRVDGKEERVITGLEFGAWFDKNFPENGCHLTSDFQ